MSSTALTPAATWQLPDRGKVGVICLISTETALFTIFVVAYIFYIGKSLTGPYPKDVLDLPIFATISLLSSSATVTMAERKLHSREGGGFRMWLGLTILLGATFLGGTALEWRKLITVDHLTISTNLFGTTYYSLVGLHASHVVVGLILLMVTMVTALRGGTMLRQGRRFQFLAWYWHFVDGVWVVVFTVVYVISRSA